MPATSLPQRHILFQNHTTLQKTRQKTLLASLACLTFAISACTNEPASSETKQTSTTKTQTISAPSENPVQAAHASAPNADTRQNAHSGQDAHSGHTHGPNTSHSEDASTALALRDIDFVTTQAPSDHLIGDANAPVTVIAYASVTCPHCGDWFTHEWPRFKSDLIETGYVKFIFREYPTPPMQLSMAGFLIANCADEQRFFEIIEYQMENQKAIFEAAEAGKARETYLAMAQKFGLKDEAEMNECLSNQAEIQRIQDAVSRAQAGKVSGAPAFFIDEVLYKGNPSFSSFKSKIDDTLKAGISRMDK